MMLCLKKEVVVHVHYKVAKEETTHAEKKNIILKNHFQCLKKILHQKLKKEHQQKMVWKLILEKVNVNMWYTYE